MQPIELLFPRHRSDHELSQRSSSQKQIPSINQKSPKSWKRFLLGFFAPALLLVATLVFLSPDFLEWTYPIVLGLAVLVGLIAGFMHKKWAFFLGVITAFATSILAVVVIEWMKH